MHYQKPRISDYGSLEELTAATLIGNTPDGKFTIPPSQPGALLTCSPLAPQLPCTKIP